MGEDAHGSALTCHIADIITTAQNLSKLCAVVMMSALCHV